MKYLVWTERIMFHAAFLGFIIVAMSGMVYFYPLPKIILAFGVFMLVWRLIRDYMMNDLSRPFALIVLFLFVFLLLTQV